MEDGTIWKNIYNNINQGMLIIYVQMAREMDEILKQQSAQPAKSCDSENGVSFLDQVVFPLYEVIAAVGLRMPF